MANFPLVFGGKFVRKRVTQHKGIWPPMSDAITPIGLKSVCVSHTLAADVEIFARDVE